MAIFFIFFVLLGSYCYRFSRIAVLLGLVDELVVCCYKNEQQNYSKIFTMQVYFWDGDEQLTHGFRLLDSLTATAPKRIALAGFEFN
jgi:hypothetical protein